MKEFEVQGVGVNGQPQGNSVIIEADSKSQAKLVAKKLLLEQKVLEGLSYEFKS